MEIVELLKENLGVSEDQAQGGAGMIFNLAKQHLSGSDFGTLSEAVPGIDNLIEAAPEAGGASGLLGGIASAFGGGAGKLAGLASLTSGFSKLGLDSDMVGKFAPVVLSYLESKGGESVKNMVAGLLK